MEFRIKFFDITIKKIKINVVRFTGGFSSTTDYRIVEKQEVHDTMRRPTSYEYKKIYRKLEEDRERKKWKEKHLEDLGRDKDGIFKIKKEGNEL